MSETQTVENPVESAEHGSDDLLWIQDPDGYEVWTAATTLRDAVDVPAEFAVALEGGENEGWYVDGSSDALLPPDLLIAPFMTRQDAQAWCEQRWAFLNTPPVELLPCTCGHADTDKSAPGNHHANNCPAYEPDNHTAAGPADCDPMPLREPAAADDGSAEPAPAPKKKAPGGVSYERCGVDVVFMANGIIDQHHVGLRDAGVTLSLLFARAPRPGGSMTSRPAVTVGGYPCAAKVKVIGLKERADGRPDAEIVIDADEWEEIGEAQREALLDHELYHLIVCIDDETSKPKLDATGRPKLKLRKHDHQFGWFDEIAKRHGDSSYEVQMAKAFADKHGQVYFGWATPPDGGIELAAGKAADALISGLVGGKPTQIIPETPAEDESWRAVLIADLIPKLKPGKLKALAENTPPLLTMGDWTDWQEKKGQFAAKDVKGFGPGGLDQLTNAMENYWAENRRTISQTVDGIRRAEAAKPESIDVSDTVTSEPTVEQDTVNFTGAAGAPRIPDFSRSKDSAGVVSLADLGMTESKLHDHLCIIDPKDGQVPDVLTVLRLDGYPGEYIAFHSSDSTCNYVLRPTTPPDANGRRFIDAAKPTVRVVVTVETADLTGGRKFKGNKRATA